MRIDIISDTICPWCFIGKRRLEAALEAEARTDVDIHWHPFELNPDLPDQGMDRKTFMEQKFGGAEGAARAYAPVHDAASAAGLDIDFGAIRRTPNTLKSHAVIHYATPGGEQERVVEGLFRGYFMEGLDIGDEETLVRIAADAGLDADSVRAKLQAGDDFNLIRTRARNVRDQGVSGVPCFVVGGTHVLAGAQESAAFIDLFRKLGQATAS